MPNIPCPDEQETQHYLGTGNGFGPVQDSETIVLALFRAGGAELGGSVTQEFLPANQLKRGELSVARIGHTPKSALQRRVVAAAEPRVGPFVGVSCAEVERVRAVVIRIDPDRPGSETRGICVIDRVTAVDHDGHAALKYADLPNTIGQTRLGRIRSIIREDLARAFGPIISLEEAYGARSGSTAAL